MNFHQLSATNLQLWLNFTQLGPDLPQLEADLPQLTATPMLFKP